MKKYLIILSIFLGILLYPKFSFATTLYEYNTNINMPTQGGGGTYIFRGTNSGGYFYPVNQYLTQSGYIYEIKFWSGNISTSTTLNLATLNILDSSLVSLATSTAYFPTTNSSTFSFIFNDPIYFSTSTPFNLAIKWDNIEPYSYGYQSFISAEVPIALSHAPRVIISDIISNPEISISLLYPVNNTSTPLFRNWVVGIDYLTSTTIGTFGVEYGLASNIYNSVDTQSIWNGTSSWGLVDNATKIIIKRNYALIASTTYFAKPYFFNSDNMTFIYGNEINFVFNSSSTPTYTTTTALAQLITPDLRIIGLPLSVSCLDVGNYTIWNMSDWKCLAINIISDLKDSMANFALGIVNQGFDIFKNIFPLNIISKFNDDINMVQATSTDIIITLEGHGSVFPDRTFTILTSSTTAWIKDELNFDYKNFITQLMYLGTGIFMVITTILVIKNSFLVQGD